MRCRPCAPTTGLRGGGAQSSLSSGFDANPEIADVAAFASEPPLLASANRPTLLLLIIVVLPLALAGAATAVG